MIRGDRRRVLPARRNINKSKGKQTAYQSAYPCFPWRQELLLSPNVGNDLLSRRVATQVSSARQSLTSVFGMGTGGPSAIKSPTLCQHQPILPGRLQPSIVGTGELNFRVRNGNGWTLTAKDADYEITGSDKQISLASDDSVHLTSVRSAAKHHRILSCCLGDKIGENS